MEEREAKGQEEQHLFMKEQVVQPDWGVSEVQGTGRWGQAWWILRLGPWTGSKPRAREMEEVQNSEPPKQNLHCKRIPRWFKSQWSLRSIRKSLPEKAMTTHSSTLAWKIPWQRSLVGCSPWGHWELDTTERLHFHFSLSCIGEGIGNPLRCSCLENPRDGGTWWAARVYGVAQSRTRL